MVICPCCGKPLQSARSSIEGLASAPIDGPVQRAIINALVGAYPRHVETQRLIEIVYADDPDGGPEAAQSSISRTVMRVRMKIKRFGWTIPLARRGPGSTGYRLQPIETIAKIKNGRKA